MKTSIFFLLAVVCFNSQAQTFQLTPGNSVTTDAPVNDFVVGNISMLNTSESPIVLRWNLEEVDASSVWDYSFCDYNTCYTGNETNGTMIAINPGSEGFVKVNAFTTAPSTAYFRFSVWDQESPNDTQIIEFWFNGVANVNELITQKKVNIYPNPVNFGSSFNLDHLGTGSKIEIVNSLGQVVFRQENISGKTTFDPNLPRGAYVINIRTNETSESRKLIIR